MCTPSLSSQNISAFGVKDAPRSPLLPLHRHCPPGPLASRRRLDALALSTLILNGAAFTWMAPPISKQPRGMVLSTTLVQPHQAWGMVAAWSFPTMWGGWMGAVGES